MENLDPYVISPKEMQELIALQAFLDSSGLEESLIELLRVNVSRLNGCAQGVRRHFRRACAIGESPTRLRALGSWQGSSLFTEREKVALEWSEAVTLATQSRVPDRLHAAVRECFTDIEVVKLTVLVAATIAWNHVEKSFSMADPQFPSGAPALASADME